jgi:hypothetical protein
MKGDYLRTHGRSLYGQRLDPVEVVCFVTAAIFKLSGGDL